MDSSHDEFKFNQSYEILPPMKIKGVIEALSQQLGDLSTYELSNEELETLSEINRFSLNEMNESQVAQYLNDFLKKVQEGSYDSDRLQEHTMFRAALTKAVKNLLVL